MKIFISSDIEGTAGIVDWKETELSERVGDYFREQMSREVAAACRGALAGGADDVLVKDAHDYARNIDPTVLPEEVKILRGWTRDPYIMMAGIDKSFAGAFFTGYHSGAGMDTNPLSHTMNLKNNYVLINGEKASELYINMLSASYNGVPSLMVTGDEGLCNWAAKKNPGMETVAVSHGIGGGSVSISPKLAVKRIEDAAKRALDKDISKLVLPLPDKFDIEICFKEHINAFKGSFYPGVTRTSANTVCFHTNDWDEVLRTLFYIL